VAVKTEMVMVVWLYGTTFVCYLVNHGYNFENHPAKTAPESLITALCFLASPCKFENFDDCLIFQIVESKITHTESVL